jgi:two-component system, NarL family, nitrate/nitrite response regulator NarL
VLALHPDLVLMDISMPVMNGIEATKQIRVLSPETKIIMLSMHDSPQIVTQAREAGAHGYSVKSRSWDDLQKTICEVLEDHHEAR